LLDLNPDDVYVDIASAMSPVPEIYAKLYRCTSYKQDLIYTTDIKKYTLGGNAAKIPVPNEFFNKMALHCSFEHFEGNSDIAFLKEAERVLSKNGKVCIVPLYLNSTYGIVTNPTLLTKATIFEDDAVIHCMKGTNEKYGRNYDIPHLISRVANNTNLKLTVYAVTNEKDVDCSCYVKFASLLEKSSP
jgi:hypothetical protein